MLSSKDLSEFLNNAENVAKISQYDRNMLEKCENLQNTIKDQETTAKEEKASIDELLAERASKQQEVQELAASTSDNISSYVSQISASQEEAAALTAEINNADNSIARLVQQAEEEKAAREAAQAQAEAEAAAAQEQSEEENSDSEDTKKIPMIQRSQEIHIQRRNRQKIQFQKILIAKTVILLMKKAQTAVKIHLTVLHQMTASHLQRAQTPVRENTSVTLH